MPHAGENITHLGTQSSLPLIVIWDNRSRAYQARPGKQHSRFCKQLVLCEFRVFCDAHGTQKSCSKT